MLIITMLACVVYMVVRDSISKVIAFAFLIYWGISIFLSEMRPFGFFKVHDETYLIILLGITSFIIGFCLYHSKRKIHYTENIPSLEVKLNKFIRSKWLVFFILLVCLYEAQFIPAAFAQAALDSTVITENRLDVMFQGNALGLLLSVYVLRPLFHVVSIIVAYTIIKKKRIPIFCWIAYISFFLVFGILNGGRALFVIFFIYLIFEFIILNPIRFFKKFNIKNIVVTIFLGGCLFFGMMHMTNYRLYGSFEIENQNYEEISQLQSESFIKYSVLPIVLFDYSLQNDYLNKFGGYTYGRMTFTGVDIIARGIAKRFGITMKSTEDIVLYLQDNWVQCTPTKQYNYAYTAFFYNYQDFGIVGIILFPLIFGVIVRWIVFRYYKKTTIPYFLLINLTFYLVVFTVFTNGINNLWVYAYFLYIVIGELMVNRKNKIATTTTKPIISTQENTTINEK